MADKKNHLRKYERVSMKVKICGITNIDDAKMAIDFGADCIGFIFAESPRQVTVEQVRKILNDLEKVTILEKVETVGVFINVNEDEIGTTLINTGLHYAQLHGDESSALTNAYLFPWYKAVRFKSVQEIDDFENNADKQWKCDRILVDTAMPGIYGGTGMAVDKAIAQYSKRRIKKTKKEFFLAGGINPDNVLDILNSVHPDGIDIGSGVEESKGKKSVGKLKKLFMEIRKYKEYSGKVLS
jgi:phosphoribosylanthranilate isomerase